MIKFIVIMICIIPFIMGLLSIMGLFIQYMSDDNSKTSNDNSKTDINITLEIKYKDDKD